jgi:regulator of protease activity HflC (stomatin/prohibitin superfamily)
MEGTIIGGIVVAVLFLWLISSMIKIVQDFERMVVFRLGRCIGAKGPGIIFLLPILDKGVRTDLREQWYEVPPQTCITKDNATVSIDFLTYMKVTDPVPSVVQVADYQGAARGIAITTLRAIVGDMLLDDVLAKRDHINETLRTKLDEATTRWGIKVTAVEIKEVIPPHDILEAMGKQMSAERNRRAIVLDANGQREAAIMRAEGQQQAAILQAEGNRQAAILQAEGYALALEKVYQVAKNVDGRTLNLQYLETLKSIGQSPSTKWIVPLELTNLVQPFSQIAQRVGAMTPPPANNVPTQQQPALPTNGNGNGSALPPPTVNKGA